MKRIAESFNIGNKTFKTLKFVPDINPLVSLLNESKLKLIHTEMCGWVCGLNFMQEYPCEFMDEQSIPLRQIFLTEEQEKQSKQILDSYCIGADFEKKETLSDKINMHNPNFINFLKVEDVKEKIKKFICWVHNKKNKDAKNRASGFYWGINDKAKEIFGEDLI